MLISCAQILTEIWNCKNISENKLLHVAPYETQTQ